VSARRTFGSIRKLPSGCYQARYSDEAGRRYTAPHTFTTTDDASRWLDDIEASIARGTWIDPNAGRVPFADHAWAWLEHRPGLKPRTTDLYTSQLRGHIVPSLGSRALIDITPTVVSAWYSALVRSCGLTSLVPAKCYRLLHAIFETARQDGIVASNPCRIAGGGAEHSPERSVATLAQVWALADVVPARFRALVLTAGFAGLRFGELAALKRSDIDLVHALITVDETLVERDNGDVRDGSTKTRAGHRSFFVPATLVPELAEHLARYVGSAADARVFVGENGGLLRRANWHVVWDKARREVGLPSFRFHDLRHTCNTLTAATGASIRELMHRMGHASPRAALRYQHATRERDEVIARALDRIIQDGFCTDRDIV
jgi:integrase